MHGSEVNKAVPFIANNTLSFFSTDLVSDFVFKDMYFPLGSPRRDERLYAA